MTHFSYQKATTKLRSNWAPPTENYLIEPSVSKKMSISSCHPRRSCLLSFQCYQDQSFHRFLHLYPWKLPRSTQTLSTRTTSLLHSALKGRQEIQKTNSPGTSQYALTRKHPSETLYWVQSRPVTLSLRLLKYQPSAAERRCMALKSESSTCELPSKESHPVQDWAEMLPSLRQTSKNSNKESSN